MQANTEAQTYSIDTDPVFRNIFQFIMFVAAFAFTWGSWFYHHDLPVAPNSEFLIGLWGIPPAIIALSLWKFLPGFLLKRTVIFLGVLAVFMQLPIELPIYTFDLVIGGAGLVALLVLNYRYERAEKKSSR
jgi:hypothetical protein